MIPTLPLPDYETIKNNLVDVLFSYYCNKCGVVTDTAFTELGKQKPECEFCRKPLKEVKVIAIEEKENV